jgi:hypothetical protein
MPCNEECVYTVHMSYWPLPSRYVFTLWLGFIYVVRVSVVVTMAGEETGLVEADEGSYEHHEKNDAL